MKTEEITFLGDGGVSLTGKIWMPKETPKMLLQISHGMTEHIGRYEKLAEAMTARGVAVAGFDLRGHGQNGGDPKCASFGEGGWKASILDTHLFYREMERCFSEIPHFMMGFSLSSFLLRDYLRCYEDKIAGRAGLKDVEFHLIPNARHDLFHEEKSGGAKNTEDILVKWVLEKGER